MPFVAGISLSSLLPGSPIHVNVLSHGDASFNHSFVQAISDDLQSTFENLCSTFTAKQDYVALSLPSFFTETEKDAVFSATKAAGLTVNRTLNHVRTGHWMFRAQDHSEQNELVLDVGLNRAAAQLMTTEVDEGIRFSDVSKDFIVNVAGDITLAMLTTQLVDPAVAWLKATPTTSGADLKRILIVNSSPGAVPQLVEELRSRFKALPIEVVAEPKLSHCAASIALECYKYSIQPHTNLLISNVVPLRVGIAKADGFVLTLLRRNCTLPSQRSAVLTTSTDNQTSVTVRIVVGVSPRNKDNTIIAELVLDGLEPRPKGVPHIRVTLDVEHLGQTHIVAEEVTEGAVSTVRESVTLDDITGNHGTITVC
ncbi:heat shock protein 70kD, peptide-binding domain-containing protein [Crassisporium funariophilum]|nr:heat shock protein 70kD, peptide-binding domain-containing protein [Crassisporium funariophilum]